MHGGVIQLYLLSTIFNVFLTYSTYFLWFHNKSTKKIISIWFSLYQENKKGIGRKTLLVFSELLLHNSCACSIISLKIRKPIEWKMNSTIISMRKTRTTPIYRSFLNYRENKKCNGRSGGSRKRGCIRSGDDCYKETTMNTVVPPSLISSSKPSNFPQQETQHQDHLHQQQDQNLYSQQPKKECPTAICRTFLWLYICFLVTGGTLAAEPYVSPSSCQYPDPVEYASVKPLSTSRGGFYPNGSKAHVDCYSNFRVKSNDPSLICINGEWTGVGGRTVECGKL